MVSEWEKSLARRVLGVKTHGFPAEFPLNQSIDHHCILRKNHQLSNIHQYLSIFINMAVCQNLVPLVNIKIAGKWMFIPLNMVLIGIDPYPYTYIYI